MELWSEQFSPPGGDGDAEEVGDQRVDSERSRASKPLPLEVQIEKYKLFNLQSFKTAEKSQE